jgi:hypothetical protein
MPSQRHCERSEAIQKAASKDWIASSQVLLAMTELMFPSTHPVIASATSPGVCSRDLAPSVGGAANSSSENSAPGTGARRSPANDCAHHSRRRRAMPDRTKTAKINPTIGSQNSNSPASTAIAAVNTTTSTSRPRRMPKTPDLPRRISPCRNPTDIQICSWPRRRGPPRRPGGMISGSDRSPFRIPVLSRLRCSSMLCHR